MIDVVAFLDALGYSIIYDEFKGDYARAAALADKALSEARQGGDAAALAGALLMQGVTHVLRGSPVAALECFRQSDEANPSDHHCRFRSRSFAYLATMLCYNTYPDGCGVNATEVKTRWGGVSWMKEEWPAWVDLQHACTDGGLSAEAWLVHEILCPLKPTRAFLKRDRFVPSDVPGGGMLANALKQLSFFRALLEPAGTAPGYEAVTDWLGADVCMRGGDAKQAGEFLESARNGYRQINDRAGQASCAMLQGDWRASPLSTPLVWNFFVEDTDSPGSGLGWMAEDQEFSRAGIDSEGAEACYDDAERLFREAGAGRGLAAVALRRGYLAMNRGNWTSALALACQARDGFARAGDLFGEHLARTHAALCRIGAGTFPEDRASAEAVGEWGATTGSFTYALGLGLFAGRVARFWLVREGDYERALSAYRLTESLFRTLGATTHVGQSLVDLGETHQAFGDAKAALVFYEQALDLYARDARERPVLAGDLRTRSNRLLIDITNLFIKEVDPDGMERSAERLRAMIGPAPTAADLAAMLAFLSGTSGTDAAPPPGLSDLAVRSSADHILAAVSVLAPFFRALILRQTGGDPAEVDALFTRALAAAREAPEALRILEVEVLSGMGKGPEAQQVYARYLERGGLGGEAPGGPSALMTDFLQGRGSVLSGLNDERRLQARLVGKLFVKDFAGAKDELDAIEREAGAGWWEKAERPWEPLSTRAQVFEGLGRLDDALEGYDKAVAVLEGRRQRIGRDALKTSLAGVTTAYLVYFHAARVALELHDRAVRSGDPTRARAFAARAFAHAERGRARALLDLMASSAPFADGPGSGSGPGSGDDAPRAWRSASTRLNTWRGLLGQERSREKPEPSRVAFLESQVAGGEEALTRAEDDLARTHPDLFEALSPQAPILDLDRLADALPPGTALLQYAHIEDVLLAWAVTRDGMSATHQAAVDTAELARQIATFHLCCARGDDPGAKAPGSALAATLLEPLAAALDANPNLIIVPYGVGHWLPFHALPWRLGPLVTSHAVSYLPSASAVQYLDREPGPGPATATDRILAVGNPSNMAYQPSPWSEPVRQQPLPAAEFEAVYVASLFPEGEALLGPAATAEAVLDRLGKARVVHFATHGFLSNQSPWLSSILLAEGGALRLDDLVGLRLRADLVVLSACQTGRGEFNGGDDVLGFARGLLAAGARSAVVSLWPVDDDATSLLMAHFYRLLRQGIGAPAALQGAQNHLRTLGPEAMAGELARLKEALEETGHSTLANDVGRLRHAVPKATTPREFARESPFYWAPFLLVGGV